jgi:predicted nuclease of predicted toxin-antitoxin system
LKLLLDENLSRRLVGRIADLFPNSVHVVEVDLLTRPDREIWDYARREGLLS